MYFIPRNFFYFLFNNEPNPIFNMSEIKFEFIPKFVWHRIIKGNGNLVVSIEEVE